jgi:carbonic anhydrase/acetyltransferase-like protein (isoleucine patch superfamily)
MRPENAGPDPRFVAFEGRMPRVHPTAFIAATAVLIGDVAVGEGASVWFHCVLRGDTNHIRIGARSNIQDGTIIHVNAVTHPTLIGEDVTVGHAAIVHACTLHNHAFVAMGATVLDGAVIEEGGFLAAGALLTPGKRIGANEMWQGAPARLQRVMDAAERAKFDQTARHYVDLAARYRASVQRTPC